MKCGFVVAPHVPWSAEMFWNELVEIRRAELSPEAFERWLKTGGRLDCATCKGTKQVRVELLHSVANEPCPDCGDSSCAP